MLLKDSRESPTGEELPRISPSIMVGVGGWAYFPLKFGNKLEICSKLYDFVEVNSTFYKPPAIDQVKKWRAAVPESFEFIVRASSQLTHEGHLEPTNKNFKILEQQFEICKELDATILHFQFPPTFEVTDKVLKGWSDFMHSITASSKKMKTRKLSLAFEIRNAKSAESTTIRSFLDEYDIIPSTDALRTSKLGVSRNSKILYTRVFGLGEHTKWSFDTNELASLTRKIEKTPAKRRYVTFHNITMYEDAARMKNIVQSGHDQVQKGPIGLDSLKRVMLFGRVKYPVSKKSLLEEFAWRTFSIGPEKKVHLEEVLQKLPEREYNSIEDLIQFLSQMTESKIASEHAQ